MEINKMVEETRKTWFASHEGEYSKRDVELLYATLALGGEVGELQNKVKKLFRLKYYTEGHSPEGGVDAIGEEIADTLFYVSRIADLLGIDADRAFTEKMAENVKRYGLASANK